MSDLVERARAYANSHRLEGHVGKLFGKLADHIDALEAENKALREALRPFAELGEAWLPADKNDDSIWVTSPDNTPVNNLTNFGFTFGHFRAAARALLAKDQK